MKNYKKIIIISSILSLILLTAFIFFNIGDIFKAFIEKSVQDIESRNIGKIIMPNNYSVIKIHVEDRVISHETGEYLYVHGNIKEVGWNEKIIIFIRVNNNKTEFGYIDMNENKVYMLSENELKKLQSDEKIDLKKVEELFPETSGYK